MNKSTAKHPCLSILCYYVCTSRNLLMKLWVNGNRKKSLPVQFNPLNWMGATLVGFLCSLVWVEVGELPDLKIFQAIIGATIVGFFQALILSRSVSHAWLWILCTSIAWSWMAGTSLGVIGWFAPRTELIMVRLTTGLTLGGIAGTWLGLWQWVVLKSVLSKSYLWIFFSSISWSLGLSIGWMIGGILHSMTHLFLGEVLGLIVVWILVGIQTGTVLYYLVPKN